MTHARAALPAALLLTSACAAIRPPDLATEVDRILESNKGKAIAVAYYDLRDGSSLFRNEHEVFHAASTMKVPVMLAVFEAVTRGTLRLDQPVRVVNQFTSLFDGSPYALDPKDDSDPEVYGWVGTEVPLETLVRHMIDRSSNLATNNVMELVRANDVMSLMKRIGANEIKVLRGVEDQKAFDHGMNNTTTAYDLMLIFRTIGEQKVISAAASEKMVNILLGQEFKTGIPAGLPEGTRVAHKTGSITRVAHDAALVFAPDGSAYVLVVLTRGFEKQEEADHVIAEISKDVWRARAARIP